MSRRTLAKGEMVLVGGTAPGKGEPYVTGLFRAVDDLDLAVLEAEFERRPGAGVDGRRLAAAFGDAGTVRAAEAGFQRWLVDRGYMERVPVKSLRVGSRPETRPAGTSLLDNDLADPIKDPVRDPVVVTGDEIEYAGGRVYLRQATPGDAVAIRGVDAARESAKDRRRRADLGYERPSPPGREPSPYLDAREKADRRALHDGMYMAIVDPHGDMVGYVRKKATKDAEGTVAMQLEIHSAPGHEDVSLKALNVAANRVIADGPCGKVIYVTMGNHLSDRDEALRQSGFVGRHYPGTLPQYNVVAWEATSETLEAVAAPGLRM